MNWIIFFILLIVTFLVYITAYYNTKSKNMRIKLTIIIFMFFLYSGLGISFLNDYYPYLIKYSLYLVILVFSILFTFSVLKSKKIGTIDSMSVKFKPIVKILSWVYILTIIIFLFYPKNVFLNIFNPIEALTNINLGSSIFQNRLERSQNILVTIIGYVRILSLPFFYITLYFKYKNKPNVIFFIILSITYLDIVISNYWGRAVLFQPIFFYILYLYKTNKISFKKIAFVSVLFIIFIIPLVNALSEWRIYGYFSLNNGNVLINIKNFIESEFSYPRLYSDTIILYRYSNSTDFLKWLITLPVPSFIYNVDYLPSRMLSEFILGISYAQPGFYILLPSWLGESFMTFGPYFYWINAVVVGIVIGIIASIIERNKSLEIYDLYFTWLLLSYLRGVSQELIAQTIQSMWILILLVIVYKIVPSYTRIQKIPYRRTVT